VQVGNCDNTYIHTYIDLHAWCGWNAHHDRAILERHTEAVSSVLLEPVRLRAERPVYAILTCSVAYGRIRT
jgi:hypothetical protein